MRNHKFEEPEKKKFKPKNPEIPKLADYQRKPPDWYWDLFPENGTRQATSKIDPDKLRVLAIECGYKDKRKLDRIVKNIREGARIGCHGPFRKPTKAKNTKGRVAE